LLGQLSRSLQPARLSGVPAALAMVAKHYAGLGLRPGELPDPRKALHHPDGLAGICTDMGVPTLISAYAKGLYPFCYLDSQTWWAPAERMVSFPETVYISKRVRRLLRLKQFDATFDKDFATVIEACAAPRPGRRSLTRGSPDIFKSFVALHAAGHAHSVEVWDRAGRLAGGLYGVAVGRVFFTESMVSAVRDASKIGFVTLSCHLQHWGFALNDGKRMSGHLSQLGFTLIPKAAFNGLLAKACREPGRNGRWAIDETLDVSRWNPKIPSTAQVRPGMRRNNLIHSIVVAPA
jgi:leucyl/phenylalanyl-tRNA---protein transferase